MNQFIIFIQQMSRVYRISQNEGVNLYTYSIRIISVKMKVKFQCKMKIEMDSEAITSQVPIVDGSCFNFNQDCVLANKSLEQDCVTLSINLITNKGAKYIAGLAFLYHQQLSRAADAGPSSRVVVALSKCLDPQAILQFVVKQAISSVKQKPSLPVRQSSKQKRSRFYMNNNFEISNAESRKIEISPPLSPRIYDFSAMQHATRSEVSLPRAGTMIRGYQPSLSKVDMVHKGFRSKSRRNIANYGEKSLANVYQNNSVFPLTERDRKSVDHADLGHDRGNSAYKDSYLKLKQRLKKQEQVSHKQHEKRVALQNNQASTKIQALKFKLKCDQLQKNLDSKNDNIKKLQTRIQQLEKLLRGQPRQNIYQKTLNINPSQQTISYEQSPAISALQSKVILANRQLEELKNKMIKMNRTYIEKQNSLIKQLEKKSMRIAKLQQQVLINASAKNTSSKNEQIVKLNLESKEKIIFQLEREQGDNYRKISQYEKINKILEKNISDMKTQMEELNRTINLMKSENQKIVNQVEAQKNKTNMAEFSASNLKKNVERLENQLQAMQKFKQKYHDALVQVKKLQGQRKLQQKSYENTSKLSQSSLTTLQNKYKQQTNILLKKNQQLEAKSMQQTLRIKELESHISSTVKNEIDNYRKNNEKLQRNCQQYRNAERMARKDHSQMQSRVNQAHTEAEVWKNKYKSMQNVSKLESDKFISQLNRIKTTLQQELINSLSLKQKNQIMSTQLAIATSKLTALQQKYSKQFKQFNNKLEMETNKVNRLQEVIKKQEALNNESRDKEKQLISKLQQYGENQSQYSELIKRYQHEISRIKSSLAVAEEKIISKQEQTQQLSKQLKQLTQKYNTIYHKSQQQSYTIKNLTSEIQKQAKQKQRLQLQITSLKMSNENKDKTIEKQKNNLELQAKNKMDLKDQMNQYNSSYDTIAKQYQRFKEQVHDLLLRELTGADGLDSLGSFQIKSRENQITLKDSIAKNMDPDYMRNSQKAQRTHLQQTKISKSAKTLNFQTSLAYSPSTPLLNNTDIINIIIQFSKESKGLLSKLIEQYRLLEKQMEECKENHQQKQSKFVLDSQKAQLAIHQLEDQISKLFMDKEESEKKLQYVIHGLEEEMGKLRDQVQKSKERLEQSLFTCNGVRMEKQTQKQFYELKIAQLNNTIKKLQNTLEAIQKKYQKLDEVHSKLKQDHDDLSRECKRYKQEIELKEKRMREFEQDFTLKSKLCQDLSSKNKAILAQVSELELSLNSEKEKNGKNLQIISQEERKLIDTKDFVNNLIKQKQAIVKQDIANGHRILQLESIKLNLQAELQNTTSKLTSKIAELAAEKDNSKKLNIANRQLQSQLTITKQQNKKLSEQLKQKQKQLSQSIQSLKSKQSQHSKQIYNKNRELQQLNSNKQLIQKLNNQQIINLKKQINRLEEEVIKQLKQEIKSQSGAQQIITMQLDNATRSLEEKSYQINSYREIQQKLNNMREQQDQTIFNLNDELREKQQQLFQISGQFSQLENKYHEVIEKNAKQRHQIEEQFQYKYDNMCEDYETKIDEIQRERDYLKQKLLNVEEELAKNNNKLRNLEEQENKERLISKDRITKTEQQKNLIVNSLKIELKKITQQKEKLQIENKKNNTEKQTLKSTQTSQKALIQKLQTRLKQCQTKLEQTQSQSYTQLQNQKKKDLYLKQYEESVVNYQWILQRQIKKQLQNVTKSIIGSTYDNPQSKRRFTDAIKDVEMRISRLVGQRIIVSNNNRGIGN